MKKRFLLCAVVLISLLTVIGHALAVQTSEQDAPATLIKSAQFLEEKPFDKDAKKVRGWAIGWLIETDKVHLKVCSLLVANIDKKYKYGPELLGQYTIGMGAFKLSNPDKANDEDAAQLAGVESALKSYEAMVAQQVKAKNAFMDDLLAKRSQNTLAVYVKENNCKESK
jgi:hypothetical protein